MSELPLRLPVVPGLVVEEVVGRGGFATVFRARQPDLERAVALKVMHPAVQADEGALRRFQQECRAIGSLTGHPGVVTVFEVGVTAEGDPYLVMEYLSGGSLQQRLAGVGPRPWPEVVAAGVAIADALAAAHELGIVHRDVKPANVLLDRFGNHKLGDFGIAALASSTGSATVGTAATVAYAAPEVLLGERADARSDLYGLGATLYALLSGRPASWRETDESILPAMLRITTAPVDPLPEEVAPEALRSLIAELLALDPTDRPLSAEQVRDRLSQVRAEAGNTPAVARAAVVAPGVIVPVAGAEDGDETTQPDRTLPRSAESVAPSSPHTPERAKASASPQVDTERRAAAAPPGPPASAEGRSAGAEGRLPRRGRKVLVAGLTVVAFLVIGIGAVGWYSKRTYYVGFEDDTVAVYQGQPGGLLFFDPSMVLHSDVDRDQLTAAEEQAVTGESTFSSSADARSWVNNLRGRVRNRTPSPPVSPSANSSTSSTVQVTTPPAGASVKGETPCPPVDGSATRTTAFASAPPTCIDLSQRYTARIATSEGDMVVALDTVQSPVAVNNFVVLARYHFFDGLPFHRIVQGFVNQTGSPGVPDIGSGGPGYDLPSEPPRRAFKVGDVAMAEGGGRVSGSQFFFTLDPGPLQGGTYPIIGTITEGTDVMAKINAHGDEQERPIKDITITSVNVLET